MREGTRWLTSAKEDKVHYKYLVYTGQETMVHEGEARREMKIPNGLHPRKV